MADETGMRPSDFAALMGNNNDWGGGNALWCFLLIILFALGGGNLGWGRGPAPAPQTSSVLDSTLSAAAAQGGFVTQSDLDGTVRMQALQTGQRDITDTVNQNKYDLANALSATESRLTASQSQLLANQQSNAQAQQACCNDLKYTSALNTSSINETTVAQSQRVLDAIAADKADRQQQRINDLERQLEQQRTEQAIQASNAATQQQFANVNSRLNLVPTIPYGFTYNAGPSPYCNCNNGCCAA